MLNMSSIASNITNTSAGKSVTIKSFSAWDLFLGADFVVQVVLLMLIAASLWTWSIFFYKQKLLNALHNQADEFEKAFWSCKSLLNFYNSIKQKEHLPHPLINLLKVAINEWQDDESATIDNQKIARMERVLQLFISKESNKLTTYMIFVGSIGSTAPFIGLFGTVWGIMHSFQDIAISGNTNLSVVAPGIAEALFATALGLIAAIPAVLIYNKLSDDINNYINRLDNFCDTFLSIVAKASAVKNSE